MDAPVPTRADDISVNRVCRRAVVLGMESGYYAVGVNMLENLVIVTLLMTNGVTLLVLGGVYWRKRVWKRRAKIADWSENVLLHNINKAADYVDRLQSWSKRKNPKAIQDKAWPDSLDE